MPTWPERTARLICALLVLAAACGAGRAQAEDETASPADLTRQLEAHDRDLETRRVGLLRLRLSYPQRLSGAVGLMRVRQPADYDCTTVCDYRGPFVQVEPGMAGIQLGAGYAVLVGERRRNEHYLASVYVGFGIKGVIARTWDPGSLDPPDQTLVGVEGAFTITSVNFSLGLLRSVSSGPVDERWVVTGGLGWGF